MAVVTDPKILAQLNGESSGAVTNPELLAQLNSAQAPVQQPSQSGFLNTINEIGNSPLVSGVLGAGDAIRNFYSDALNFATGTDLGQAKTGSGTAYDIGKVGGDVASFIGGGELLDAARIGAKAIPMIGKAASALEGSRARDALRRTLGSAAFGGLTNPDDRLYGAGLGAGFGLAAEAVPALTNVLTKPRKTAEGIMDYITAKKDEASKLYDKINKTVGENPIYENKIPMYGSIKSARGEFANIPSDIFSTKNSGQSINAAYTAFDRSPTFEKAHKLQSDLGKRIGTLQDKKNKSGLSTLDENRLTSLTNARSAVREDMFSHLRENNPMLANDYLKATNIYRDVVDPFRKLSQLENPGVKEISSVMEKLGKKKGALSPELKTQLKDLSTDKFRQALAGTGLGIGLGGLGYEVAGGHISPANLVEGLIAGKLLGVKAPKSTGDAMQNLFNRIDTGAQGLGTVLKSTQGQ